MWGQIGPTVKNASHLVTYRRIRQTVSPPPFYLEHCYCLLINKKYCLPTTIPTTNHQTKLVINSY